MGQHWEYNVEIPPLLLTQGSPPGKLSTDAHVDALPPDFLSHVAHCKPVFSPENGQPISSSPCVWKRPPPAYPKPHPPTTPVTTSCGLPAPISMEPLIPRKGCLADMPIRARLPSCTPLLSEGKTN